MANCYLTGVQFLLEEGHILNRRESHHLLRTLRDRANSLQRLIDQLSPLDEAPAHRRFGRKPSARKRHRLICKAVAEALAPGYPEVRLFLPWPEYREKALLIELRNLRSHPLYGSAISALSEQALLEAAVLGKRVVRMLDPLNKFSQQACIAIKAGICVHRHSDNATDLVHLIRGAIEEKRDLADLGVPEEVQKPVFLFLSSAFTADSIDHRTQSGGNEDECIL